MLDWPPVELANNKEYIGNRVCSKTVAFSYKPLQIQAIIAKQHLHMLHGDSRILFSQIGHYVIVYAVYVTFAKRQHKSKKKNKTTPCIVN